MDMKTFNDVAFALTIILTVGVTNAYRLRACATVNPKPAFPEFGQPNLSPIDALPESARSCLRQLSYFNESYSDFNNAFKVFFSKVMDLSNFYSAHAYDVLNCLDSPITEACLRRSLPKRSMDVLKAYNEFGQNLLMIGGNDVKKQMELVKCVGRKKDPGQSSKYQILHQKPNATKCALPHVNSKKVLSLDDIRYHFTIELAAFAVRHEKEFLSVLRCLNCRLMDKAANIGSQFFHGSEAYCIRRAIAQRGYFVLKGIVLRFSKTLRLIAWNNVGRSKNLVRCIR